MTPEGYLIILLLFD